MNVTWAREILDCLHAEGVRSIVVCPGARNSALITVLSRTDGFVKHSFFDERAAGFFALGVARRTGQPVAVITTSGTAAAELLPATIEAFHTGVPLILVTADRPRRLRGTGAPQAIDQTGLFGKFVAVANETKFEFDLEVGGTFSLHEWNRRVPVHLNLCFDEPLIDESVTDLVLTPRSATESFAGRSKFPISASLDWSVLRLTKFLRSRGPLAVIVGTLETDAEREAVTRFLQRLRAPCYLEATSGLRESESLAGNALRSGESLLSWGLRNGLMGRVLRIGGIPTVRIWRDLDHPRSAIEVLSISSLPFAGLGRGEFICSEIVPVLTAASLSIPEEQDPEREMASRALLIKDRSSLESLRDALRGEAFSEPSLINALSRAIPESSLVYLGNSLPIREWDLAASFERSFEIAANRGVNGIDGQIATFLGLARSGNENWAILGDLTTLYDLTGPWALMSRDDLTIRIVVVNNGGGKIFSRVFGSDLFENRHTLAFEHWAKMWGLEYRRWEAVPENIRSEIGDCQRIVVELVPDALSTTQFWDRYDGFWA